MNGTIHRMTEVSGVLFFVFVFFLAVTFAALHWQEALSEDYVRCAAEEFLVEAAKEGCITETAYHVFLQRIAEAAGRYEISLTHVGTREYPVYQTHTEEEWTACFARRNRRRESSLPEWNSKWKEIPPESLKYREDGLWLSLQELPLAGNEKSSEKTMKPAENDCRVYVGEQLVTAIRVESAAGIYYLPADPMEFSAPGIWEKELVMDGKEVSCVVTVTVYPRVKECGQGHCYTNTKERIRQEEQEGTSGCPYCAELPKSGNLSEQKIVLAVGDALLDSGLYADLVFGDGQRRRIFPSDKDWEDDYDENYCGTQFVTVCYRGVAIGTVVVVSEGRPCFLCGSLCVKTLADYEEYPLCAACMAGRSLFFGEYASTRLRTGQEEISAVCADTGYYVVPLGDELRLSIFRDGTPVIVTDIISRKDIGEKQ